MIPFCQKNELPYNQVRDGYPLEVVFEGIFLKIKKVYYNEMLEVSDIYKKQTEEPEPQQASPGL